MLDSYERVCALIDLDNIDHNITQIENVIKAPQGIYAVIKADGYGHGAVAVARTLADMKCVWGYAVATIDEAMEIAQGRE